MLKTIIVLSLGAGFAIAHADQKVTFQYNFKKGQVVRTHLVMNADMSMGKSSTTMDTSMRVDDAKDDGSASLSTQIDSGEFSMGPMKMAIPGKGKQFHMTVSKFGKQLETSDNAKALVVVQEFPDHPIAVGESWDGSVQIQAGRTPTQINAHFTLDSIKSDHGHKIAHLLMVEDGEIKDRGDIKIHATGWMDWDLDQSLPVASHVEGTEDMGKMNMNFVADSTSTLSSS